ncbi:hypothetical protein [Alicyclobacillus vulcanalis]|uniref:Glycosyl transferase family 2 n=1 Tax=Alicyclobacillus vulcanalis TaxID=252246 RepID=A0A1N7MHZ4_9BACL|nr:hypothetical protein [Alicyclobacillus vulcanalis]SIS85746.1 hypothetical protein SAMN05421799_105167 [Alicyclobacillus vulcanalis]
MANVRDVACALGARDEAGRIANVLRQLARAGIRRIALCANGCRDATLDEARTTAEALALELAPVEFREALGHDAPRAIAAMQAWRRWPDAPGVLMVDADWQGGFGPMLAEFLRDALANPGAITGVSGHVRDPDLDRRWQDIARLAGSPPSLRPFLLPQYVPLCTFARVSPRFVASPGLFFALTRRAGTPWRVYGAWDGRLLGNPIRGAEVAARVVAMLREDACAAEAILTGCAASAPPLCPGERAWPDVEAWMSCIRWEGSP